MATLKDITSPDWQPKLGEIGAVVQGIDDIKQCINIILSTPKGSVPFLPDFGSDLWKYVDYPINQATPYLIKETIDAIEMWEQRIRITNIEILTGETTIIIKLQCEERKTGESQTIEVTV